MPSRDPMHIGFLTPEYATPVNRDGGLANYLRKVGRALANRGHEVTVLLASNRHARWMDGSVAIEEVRRATLPALASRVPGLRQVLPALALAATSRRLASAVWRIHRERPFTVLQASSFAAPGLALLGNSRIPVVCRISSYTPLYRTAYGRRRGLDEVLTDWLEARQVAEADAAFSPSRLMAKAFERLEGCRVEVIRTPIDSVPVEEDPGFAHEALPFPYLLFFGTLSRMKGLGVLAEALPGILARHPDLHMVFIGRDDGIPGERSAFAHVAARCGAQAGRLHHHGALPQARLRPAVRGARAVLMPSLVDNYPNACIEALSLGAIVIGTRDSSLDEILEDGRTGFLAENGSAGSLAEAVERALALPPAEAEALRERVRGRVLEIEAEDRVGRLLEFYGTVIEGFRSPSRSVRAWTK